MTNELEDLKSRIDQLEADLESAKDRLEALIIANNAFRSAMLSRPDPPSVDQIYLAKSKNSWNSFDITVLMQFYEVFSAHTQIFTDLITQKKGRNAISDHLLAKAAANAREVKAFNEKSESKTPAARASKKALARCAGEEVSEADRNKRRALQGLMSTLKLSETAARAMLDGMGKNV